VSDLSTLLYFIEVLSFSLNFSNFRRFSQAASPCDPDPLRASSLARRSSYNGRRHTSTFFFFFAESSSESFAVLSSLTKRDTSLSLHRTCLGMRFSSLSIFFSHLSWRQFGCPSPHPSYSPGVLPVGIARVNVFVRRGHSATNVGFLVLLIDLGSVIVGRSGTFLGLTPTTFLFCRGVLWVTPF